eukprot:SAG22_NODE_1465_length_4355_cov_31.402491_3_plen_302_part_00
MSAAADAADDTADDSSAADATAAAGAAAADPPGISAAAEGAAAADGVTVNGSSSDVGGSPRLRRGQSAGGLRLPQSEPVEIGSKLGAGLGPGPLLLSRAVSSPQANDAGRSPRVFRTRVSNIREAHSKLSQQRLGQQLCAECHSLRPSVPRFSRCGLTPNRLPPVDSTPRRPAAGCSQRPWSPAPPPPRPHTQTHTHTQGRAREAAAGGCPDRGRGHRGDGRDCPAVPGDAAAARGACVERLAALESGGVGHPEAGGGEQGRPARRGRRRATAEDRVWWAVRRLPIIGHRTPDLARTLSSR